MVVPADAVEREWLDRVHKIRCVLCVHLGLTQGSKTQAHHPREGQGLSQRAAHCGVAGICKDHHQGPGGIHGLGTRGFYSRYRMDETDLVELTVKAVFTDLAREHLGIRPPGSREKLV